MSSGTLVSVIMPFYNTDPAFMAEAIDSVLAQSYQNWELLLIDDGSVIESSSCARRYENAHRERIRYLEHPGHENRGASAARQLGISHAQGTIIAMLDADDVWMPGKLEEQVGLLLQRPEVGALYGKTKYWYSWTGNSDDVHLDHTPELGLAAGSTIDGVKLLEWSVDKKIPVPCTCSIIIREDIVRSAGGFEAELPTIYDDQMFYSKVFLHTQVLAVDRCWDWYRQHPSSGCSQAALLGQIDALHHEYLEWLSSYLISQGVRDRELWQAVRRQTWHSRLRRVVGATSRLNTVLRRASKWLLRLEDRLPQATRRFLWARDL